MSWNTSDTTTQTNLNGTQAAPPVNDNWNGSDVQVAVNGVVTDQGPAPAVPASTNGGNAPAISGVVAAGAVAAQGNTDGSTVVVLTGTGFTSDTQVTFDGVACSNAIVLSSTQIVAVAPAHAAGTVHVLAANTAGSSVSTPANQFAYQAAGASTAPSGSNSQPDANLTLAQKQQVWALQAEMLRLVGRIQEVKQQLANGNLAPASQKTHQTLLNDLQNRLQTIECQLNITHQPADPVASMNFGEKFVAALEIVLKDGQLEAGIKAKLEQLLEPENLAKLVGTMTAMAAVYATLHGTPLAPLLAIADVGMAASVGTETALALFQIYLDLDSATTQPELQAVAGGMANQLSGKLVDVIVSAVTKTAAKGAAAGVGKAVGKRAKTRASAPEHHIATNKNRVSTERGGPWTPRFEKIFKKAGMTLEDSANKVRVPGHNGPHPEEYHVEVFRRLRSATDGRNGIDYTRALVAELAEIAVECRTKGSTLNKLITQ